MMIINNENNKKDTKNQKQIPVEKPGSESKKKGFVPPSSLNNPKPFQQFSNQNKFKGSSPKSFNAFHRRLGK